MTAASSRIGRQWVIAVTLLTLTASLGCTNNESSSAPSGGPRSNTARPTENAPRTAPPVSNREILDCRSSIDRRANVVEDYEVILGVVALPTSAASRNALQTTDNGGADPQTRLSTKNGLLVRGGALFELIVPQESRNDFSLSWPTTKPTWRLEVECPSTPGGWLAFAGGFRARHVGCYPLIVRTKHREQRVQLGIGAPCPGQDPPPPPSTQ